MFNLADKVALVTGASSGIGYGIALTLATQGAKVIVAARRVDKLKSLVDEIKKAGGEATAVQMDVTKKSDIANAVASAVKTYGKLDILVNNAGVVNWSTVETLTEEGWDKTLDTNLKAYFFVTQEAVKAMEKNTPSGGRIINIASIASGGVGVGFNGITDYCASKGGVVGMTEALAIELAPKGILVNCIGPGLIISEMTQAIVDDPKQMAGLAGRIPLKRPGTAAEIASAVVYFSADESSYTTGATLYVDGGWLAN
ncbi:SDR family oxidoreductase [Candidatus Gottesmanbacteria bacterium]|nr:SDR family oxidoreductase [Candidatus Gottesmanbacteria bacterium]